MRLFGRHAAAALAALAVTATATATTASADEAKPAGERRGPAAFLSLGVGAGPDYLGSDDYQLLPYAAALFFTPYADVAIIGPSASVDLLGPQTGRRFLAGPTVAYRFGRDDVESAAVDRMADVDASVELGGFVGYRIIGVFGGGDSLTMKLDLAADVADGHGGATLEPSVRYQRRLTDRLGANLGASAGFATADFMSSYFDVTAADAAASGLSVFDADSGFYNAGVSAGLTYDLTEHFGLFAQGGATFLLGDAADSPVVDREGSAVQLFGGTGVSYRF